MPSKRAASQQWLRLAIRRLWEKLTAAVRKAPGALPAVANIASVMIATASLLVAIVALHYYIESAREQQIALESSRRALETMVSSAKTQQEVLDASSGTLEGMLAMSKLQGQSMKEQQALVEESVRASKKQLSIIQEQYEVERKRPDVRIFNVHRVFSGDDLSVALRNVSSKVARDITLKGFFTILRAEPFAVPVKIWDINYLRAGDVRSQWLEIDFPKGFSPDFLYELSAATF